MSSRSWADIVSGKKISSEDTVHTSEITIPKSVTPIVAVDNLKEDKSVEDRTKKPPPGFEHVIPNNNSTNNNSTKKIIFKMKDKEIIETILRDQKKAWTLGQNRIQFFLTVCLSPNERMVLCKKLKKHNLKMRIIGKDIEIYR